MAIDITGIEIRQVSGKDDIHAILRLFEQVCGENNWVMDDCLQKFLSSSVFWAAYHSGELIAAVQLVIDSPVGIPATQEHAWPDILVHKSDGMSSAEIAMVAVQKEYRGASLLFISLYSHAYIYCRQNGITHLYGILNKQNLRLYRLIGMEYRQIGQEKLYWNDPSFPAEFVIEDVEHSIRRKRPEIWKQIESVIGSS